jgi:CheY-like chemotaxis protein
MDESPGWPIGGAVGLAIGAVAAWAGKAVLLSLSAWIRVRLQAKQLEVTDRTQGRELNVRAREGERDRLDKREERLWAAAERRIDDLEAEREHLDKTLTRVRDERDAALEALAKKRREEAWSDGTPADTGAIRRGVIEEVRALARPLAGVRILLVENDAQVAGAIAVRLEGEGASVAIEYDADGAEECYARGAVFDVLLVDISLGRGRDGLALLRGLREHDRARGRPEPKAIAVSGHDESEFGPRALAAGFSHYYAKPIEYEELVGVIRRVCGRD